MITGTSACGLIAVILGRLRLSVDECIEAHRNLSKELFEQVRLSVKDPGKVMDLSKANGRRDEASSREHEDST